MKDTIIDREATLVEILPDSVTGMPEMDKLLELVPVSPILDQAGSELVSVLEVPSPLHSDLKRLAKETLFHLEGNKWNIIET